MEITYILSYDFLLSAFLYPDAGKLTSGTFNLLLFLTVYLSFTHFYELSIFSFGGDRIE